MFAGDIPTAGATVTLTYTAWEKYEITLTAAQNGEPKGENAVKKASIEVEVPFKLEQNYILALANPKDITLVPTSAAISDERSNTDFGISVSVNGGAAKDILSDNVETSMGVAKADEKTTLAFTLHNGNALSDIVTERYVDIKLVGSNGVIIPVTIIINREMSLAGDAKSAIQGGKEYLQVSGEASQVTVSSDSAFTAQFVVQGLIPDNYRSRILSFSNPAAGATIVMIDWTHANAPKYYHYTLNTGDTSVALTSFKEMGTSRKYSYPTGETPVTERFLFIVDLPDAGAAGGTIGLTTTGKNDEGTKYTTLTYDTASQRGFALTPQALSTQIGNSFSLNYSTSASGASESRYVGRQMALVIAGDNIPVDGKIVMGDNSYSLNASGQFIIPLGGLRSGTCTMSYFSAKNTGVTLRVSLWVSANAAATSPLMGEQKAGDVTITVLPETMPSLKAVSMSRRIFTPNDLKSAVNFTYTTKNMAGSTVTLEAQVKEGQGYRTITTVLNTVDGSPATAGIYSVSENGDTLSLKFSEQTPQGTYRLLLTVKKDGAEVLVVPYNFVVVGEQVEP